MKLFRRTQLALLLPLLVAGCAGKGSFEPVAVVDEYEAAKKMAQELTSQPSTNEELEPQDLGAIRNALGWTLDIMRRNQARHKKDGSQYGYVKRVRSDGVIIDFPEQAEGSIPIDPEKMKPNHKPFSPSKGFKHVYVGFEDYDDWGEDEIEGPYNKPHKLYVGHTGTLRFLTDNTAKALPDLNQEFTYSGVWAYMTDIDVLREELAPPAVSGGNVTWSSNGKKEGVDYSGTSYFDPVVRKNSEFGRIGHHAEFKVHFGEKRLTGTLSRTPERLKNKPPHNAYVINASINGHRFSGSATVNPMKDQAADENYTYFRKGAKHVEGGFYGDTGQELAGSFLADDKSIVVAFGAKRNEVLDANAPLKYLVDGAKIAINHNENFAPSTLNNFSGFKYLFVDGHNIPLAKGNFIDSKSIETEGGEIKVSYCCQPFDHLKLGEVNHKGVQDSSNRSLFLQGERTKEMPVEGKARYQGTWQASIIHRNVPHSVTPEKFDEGTRAAFEADFGEKKLTGQLWRHNDISSAPSVLIEADIAGSAFEGVARTGEYGINIDPDRVLNNHALHFKTPTKGVFYGSNASELGGSFSYSDVSKGQDDSSVYDKVGAVYGAKQVIEQK